MNEGHTPATQQAFYEYLGSYYDQPGCYGVATFCVADYETVAHYGMYDESLAGSAPRSACRSKCGPPPRRFIGRRAGGAPLYRLVDGELVQVALYGADGQSRTLSAF